MKRTPQPKAAVKVDVPVRSTASRSFLATIEGVGRNEQGQIVGRNGIRWSVPAPKGAAA